MTEYWQRTEISGTGGGEEGKTRTAREVVLHRRGEDPVVMACRRNRELAGCSRMVILTEEAFMQIRKDDRRSERVIPRGRGNDFDEWDW